METTELKQRIEEQRNRNVELYNVFQYRLYDEKMEPIIDEWRLGSKKLKQMLVELQELELKKPQKHVSKDNSQTFVNGFGEATKRNITCSTYERTVKRNAKSMLSFVGGI